MSPSEPATKRRNRLSLSCNYCKKRKVKCDRGRPCTSCVKYHVPELCEYPIFSDNFKGSTELDEVPQSPGMGKTPTFTIQNLNEFDRIKPGDNSRYMTPLDQTMKPYTPGRDPSPGSTSGKSASPEQPSSQPNPLNELDYLKDRIKYLEHKFSGPGPNGKETGGEENNLSVNQAQPKYQIPPNNYRPRNSFDALSAGYSRHGSFSFSVASPMLRLPAMTPTNGNQNPNPDIQLSPLNWNNSSNGITDYTNSAINLDTSLTRDLTRGKINVEIKAKVVGINRFDNPDSVMDFYAGYNPQLYKDETRRIIFGIYAWLTFLLKDEALRTIYDYLQNSLQQNLYSTNCVIQQGANLKPSDLQSAELPVLKYDTLDQTNENEQRFRDKASKYEAFTDNKPYAELSNEKSPCIRSKLNEGALSLGLYVYEGDISKELEVADQVVKILPCKRVIWLLINKFFTHVYPYMPFFDETSFKLEIARIIGPEDYVEAMVEKLNVEKRLDFAYVGIMLLMLRFAYLSLFSNRKQVNEYNLKGSDPDPKMQELKFLLSNPISIQVVDMAQLCANQFDILKKSSIVVLQLVYALRLYTMFGPEKGDGADGGASQITNGMIIQIAFSMGINREPERFYSDDQSDGKTNNLIRKLWFFMVITDLIQGYQYGNPLAIDDRNFDVRLPFYKKGNENIEDVQMEKDVISSFAYFEKYYTKLKGLLDTTTRASEPCKIKELVDKLSDFEEFVYSIFGNIQDYMSPFSQGLYKYPFIKTMKCKNFINLNGFIISILAHLQSHFERAGNVKLSMYYLKKVIILGTMHFLPYYNDLIGNNHINFGESADLILNPTVIAFMHKTHQFNMAVFVKTNAAIHALRNSGTHEKDMKNNYSYQVKFYKYCKLSKVLEKVTKYSITSVSRLSDRYYYAWRITKAHSFIFHVITKSRIYESCDFKRVSEGFLKIPLEDIDDLILLYDTTLKQVNEGKATEADIEIKMNGTSTKKNPSPPKTQADTPNTNPTPESTTKPATNGNSVTNDWRGANGPAPNGPTSNFTGGITPNSTIHWPSMGNEAEYTPHSTSSSDNDYHEMVNNKDVDNLWLQLIGESGGELRNDPTSITFEGNYNALESNDIYNDLFKIPDSFSPF